MKKDVFVLAVPNLPNPIFQRKLAKKTVEFLNSLDGLISITPHYPEGTLLTFKTLNDAKIARNLFRAEGNSTGNYIMHGTIDKEKGELVIGEPAEEISPEDKRRLEER